ncbi:T9SS type A sorting domain-containing protein [Foetidibacter luteolus]|uniref:T9SS type A sorting domain-containing protein n=1 Tax=Foetidibacter luteolus TaxID=2608880 RepID=UPI001A996591|nr:T9SS type A sorting domain-containing protein [Foetidibacter luteolus]
MNLAGQIQKAVALMVLLVLSKFCYPQIVNKGAAITIQNGGLIFTSASFSNTIGSTVTNDGEIITNADLINDSAATLSGNGRYSVQLNFNNKGLYNYGTSVLRFFGAANSNLSDAGKVIYKLLVDKSSTYLVNLLNSEKVLDSVIFFNDNTWVKLNNTTFTLAENSKIHNTNGTRFFITNGTGSLKKLGVKNSSFVFPVGFDELTYNRVRITENGVQDAYSVRCRDVALLNGSTGAPISTGGIKAGWVINEATAGGANATIELLWRNTDELPGFDYTRCMVSRYGASWSYQLAQSDTAVGSPYRYIARSGFTGFGEFTVLSGSNPSIAGLQYIERNVVSKYEPAAKEITIYPTIVQNNFNVQVPGNIKGAQKMNLQVTDANGRIVWQKQNADFSSQKFSLPNLITGYYFVIVTYNGKKVTQKIMVSY